MIVLNVKRSFGKDFEWLPPKSFLESPLGMVLASKTLFPACKTPFLSTMKQSLILMKAELAQASGSLVPEILGNDL